MIITERCFVAVVSLASEAQNGKETHTPVRNPNKKSRSVSEYGHPCAK